MNILTSIYIYDLVYENHTGNTTTNYLSYYLSISIYLSISLRKWKKMLETILNLSCFYQKIQISIIYN